VGVGCRLLVPKEVFEGIRILMKRGKPSALGLDCIAGVVVLLGAEHYLLDQFESARTILKRNTLFHCVEKCVAVNEE